MNGKQAKRLRRQAQAETVGLPYRNYGIDNQRKRLNRNGGHVFDTFTFILENCTRARYQQLKKEYKRA